VARVPLALHRSCRDWSERHVKPQLHDIPALSFAGLRYGLAFVCLLGLLLGRPALRSSVLALTRREWLRLGALGLLLYGLTQATVFLGLTRLPAVTVSLLLSLSPALVTVLAIPLLREVPTPVQRGGVLLAVVGALMYLGPVALPAGQLVAVGVVAVGVVAFATMLVHVAVLAWMFLGERPGARGILDLVLAAGGVVLVQLHRVGNRETTSQTHH